ncbi:MAG: aminoglycoside phosphotransferase family enzyme/predicted kinase [Pirellulaceae bacterium]|jgi:aminoglycoside phosphotransferase family enzyme/predicted kinase
MALQPTCSENFERRVERDEIVSGLQERTAYPYQFDEVEFIETHISWVFLTDRHAYKVKKPVRFEFLDYSTIEKRYQMCLDEVQLNRRLAPHVYVDVQPITRSTQGNLHVGGDGAVVDWAVRMRRLDESTSLETMIVNQSVEGHAIKLLGDHLVTFYNRQPPVLVHTDAHRQQTEKHITANWNELRVSDYHLNRALIDRIHQSQLQLIRVNPELLDNRVLDGRIVEGHGDLRPEHIYFTPDPVVIDCIEFNREFRTLDVFDELNFLAMECERLGAHEVGTGIIDAYLTASGDRPDQRLGSFYRSYRACVRAKVAVLRSRQQSPEDAKISLELANRYLHIADIEAKKTNSPLMLIVSGQSGSGKTTLASELAASLQIDHLQTDTVRSELLGESNGDNYNQGPYSPDNRDKVYEALLSRAESKLLSGLSVVVDGTFLKEHWRGKAFEIAKLAGARPLLIECQCPPEIAKRRIAHRLQYSESASRAQPEFYDLQLAAREPSAEAQPVCEVDTTTSAPLMLRKVYQTLG